MHAPDYDSIAPSTIFGQKFLLTAIDEAHRVRTVKKSYWASFSLRERSSMTIAVTATPAVAKVLVWKFFISSHSVHSHRK